MICYTCKVPFITTTSNDDYNNKKREYEKLIEYYTSIGLCSEGQLWNYLLLYEFHLLLPGKPPHFDARLGPDGWICIENMSNDIEHVVLVKHRQSACCRILHPLIFIIERIWCSTRYNRATVADKSIERQSS